ncbi:aldehyde dehydrogenase family protein [Motilibacter aurantiacus]|uniref:aldehyde dehydrogenase family protein n=1 Tax=Motilibacter aurantiacus TaxID=2714955 RepID=UPI00140CA449|nr:aldehyde dehydrogenase family protein [Motilibacter aurantiacus]
MTVISRSPQDPDDVVLETGAAGREAVLAAAERARTAYASWAATPASARGAALTAAATAVEAVADELAALVVREVGKPVVEARGEVARAVGILRYYAQAALLPEGDVLPAPDGRSLLHTRRRPRGVAGLLTPWNFPLAIPVWKAAPALAYGNTVLLKPAEEAPACAERLAELLAASLPADVLTVLQGGGETGAAVVGVADVVSFTGSEAVGAVVRRAAAERGVPAQCEMGGQNASVVLPDADLDAAAAAIAGAAMGYAGQKCTATSRVVVVGDAEAFAERLATAVEALGFGDPAEAGTALGPVISPQARDAVVGAVAEAEKAGARVLTGGTASGPGWAVAPAVVARVPDGHRLLREEVFGPVCAVVGAPDVDAAVAEANAVRHGLVAAVFTRDLARGLELPARLRTGMVKVNAPTSGVDFHAPFGGTKSSSYGPREQGLAAKELYTETATVTITP